MNTQFKEFFEALKRKDEVVWNKLFLVAKTIFEHAAESEKLELNWAKSADNISTYYPAWFERFFENFKNNFSQYENQIKDFQSLKDLILKLSKAELDTLFACFLVNLRNNNSKTWNDLHKPLFKLIKNWIYKRGIIETDIATQIYYEGMEVFYSKVSTSNVNFDNSKKLKSYFLKIIENKIKESHKELKISYKFEHIEQLHIKNILFTDDYQEQKQEEELARSIHHLIAQLNKDEREIITGYFFNDEKLKDIAKKVNITEENCRIIKYRAIKKLKTLMATEKIQFEL